MTKYSTNQIATAGAKLFSVKHGIETSLIVSRAFRRSFNANEKQFTWIEINGALCVAGWSSKHLVMLMSNLKNL